MTINIRLPYYCRNHARDAQIIVFEGRCQLNDNCCICMSSINNKSVYHTPCGHTYHTVCFRSQIEQMRDNNTMCALCRYDLRIHILVQPNLYIIEDIDKTNSENNNIIEEGDDCETIDANDDINNEWLQFLLDNDVETIGTITDLDDSDSED